MKPIGFSVKLRYQCETCHTEYESSYQMLQDDPQIWGDSCYVCNSTFVVEIPSNVKLALTFGSSQKPKSQQRKQSQRQQQQQQPKKVSAEEKLMPANSYSPNQEDTFNIVCEALRDYGVSRSKIKNIMAGAPTQIKADAAALTKYILSNQV